MMAHLLRRWPNIDPASLQRFVFFADWVHTVWHGLDRNQLAPDHKYDHMWPTQGTSEPVPLKWIGLYRKLPSQWI